MGQENFKCKWLTPLITFEQYGNDWKKYRRKLYDVFLRDFVENQPDMNRDDIELEL